MGEEKYPVQLSLETSEQPTRRFEGTSTLPINILNGLFPAPKRAITHPSQIS